MRKIEEFEDFIAWQKARELTRAVYEATRQGAFAKDYGLSGQIQRAAVSIMSNIMVLAKETGKVVGGLRVSVERRRDTK